MAFATGDGIRVFGTKDSLDSTSASIATLSFSIATDVVSPWTNDDDAPEAAFFLEATFATSTNIAGSAITLFARLMNYDASNNDMEIPSDDNPVIMLGNFNIPAAVTSLQRMPLSNGIVPLPGAETSADYEFYIRNGSPQTMSAGWVLYVTPVGIGPQPA